MDEREFKKLFGGLCCSQCRNDFDLGDIFINYQRKNISLCHLKCHKCGKDFGEIVLNFNPNSKQHLELEVIEGAPPISADDVINAHEFIKKNL